MNSSRTTILSITLGAILFSGAILPFVSQQAYAQVRAQDDINPAPYAGQDNTVFVHWKDFGIVGDVPDCANSPSGLALFANDAIPVAGPLNNGAPDITVGSGFVNVFTPNIEDPFEKKLMRIQVTWCPLVSTGIVEPTIDSSSFTGSDAEDGPLTMVNLASHVDETATTAGADYFYEDWELYPNPDWETFQITYNPEELIIVQVVVDTMSIPVKVGGTFEGVSTTALLVAGAEQNALWLLPLIAGLGVGLVIIRKKQVF